MSSDATTGPLPSTRVVILPPLGGKSTLARRGLVYDPDDAMTDYVSKQLAPLRDSRDWDAYNAVWRPALGAWAAKLPKDATIMAHGFADADFLVEARGGGQIYVYAIPIATILVRIMGALTKEQKRGEIAIVALGSLLGHPRWGKMPVATQSDLEEWKRTERRRARA